MEQKFSEWFKTPIGAIILIWFKKTIVFTPIGGIISLLFYNANNNWIDAFLSIYALFILAISCLIINLITNILNLIIEENCEILEKVNNLLHREMLEAYWISLTYLTGLCLGMYPYIEEISEWKKIFYGVVCLGYILQFSIYVIYNLDKIIACIIFRIKKLFPKLENSELLDLDNPFLKRMKITINIFCLIGIIFWVFLSKPA